MAITNVDDEHHVVRHCRKRVTIRKDGVVIGINPTAFDYRPANPPLRPLPEKYLSAILYEYFNGQTPQMKACCGALAFKPNPGDALARFHVGRLKKPFVESDIGIRVTHEGGGRHHAAYAAIRPGKPVSELLAVKIISDALVELVEVRNL